MPPAAKWAAIGLFLGLLAGTSLLLWNAHRLSLPQQLSGALAIVAGLWAVGRVSEPATRRSPSPGR